MAFQTFVRAGLLAGALVLAALPTPSWAMGSDQAQTFITTAIQRTVEALSGKGLSVDERIGVLNRLADTFTDRSMIGRGLLGRYWERASTADREKFMDLMLTYTGTIWARHLADLPPRPEIAIIGATPVGDVVIVQSKTGGVKPMTVEWVVTEAGDGRPVIVDVAIEGVSPIRTMGEDFKAVLRANGGQMESLMEALKVKIAAQ